MSYPRYVTLKSADATDRNLMGGPFSPPEHPPRAISNSFQMPPNSSCRLIGRIDEARSAVTDLRLGWPRNSDGQPMGRECRLSVALLYRPEVAHCLVGSKFVDLGGAGVSHEVMRHREDSRGQASE